jgi:hypothetical protein
MTTSPPPDPLIALQESISELTAKLSTYRGQLSALSRYAHDKDDSLAAQIQQLSDDLGDLAATVTAALDAAAPRGPAAPRWDNLDTKAHHKQLAWLTEWVTKILVPCYVRGGPYTLADCWARHEAALWELGTIAAQWNRVFNRKRPDLALALEFFDRWLPDAMRRVEDATRICSPRHNPT